MADRLCLLSSAFMGEDAPVIAQMAVSAGLPAIEWGVGPGQAAAPADGDARRLRELSETHGLRVAGVIVQGGTASLEQADGIGPIASFASEIGAGYLRFFAPGYAGGSFADAQRTARAGLAQAVEIAGEHGLSILIETAPGTLAPSTTLALALLEGHPPAQVGVLYDPGNGIIEGFLEPRLAIAELGDYLQQVHVKNISWHRVDGAWEWQYASFADGMLDWAAILAELVAAGYAGCFCIDHLAGPAELDNLQRETDLFRSLLEAATG